MKKVLFILAAALSAFALAISCEPKEDPEMSNAIAKVRPADVVDAAAAAYAVWEDDNTIPEKLSVAGTAITKAGNLELTLPQYQYALAKTIVSLKDGKKDEILVQQAKAASHPERDSYDKAEIAVTGGAAIKDGVGDNAKAATEDIADLARRFCEAVMTDKTVPNSVLVVRPNEDAIAFSTNRLTVCMLRTLAEYKKASALPANISTEYLSAAATLKGFAQQFVKILEIWENTVGTVSADGSHCTDNNSAWQNVHFVPIPHSGGAYADGKDQYDAKYQPYFTVEIDGTTYTSAQTWGIALRGIMDLITKEGSAYEQKNRNPFEHTMGNGASLKEPIPGVIAEDIWGQYPWYESTNDAQPINKAEFTPFLIARCASWFLTRQKALGKIGNYQLFGTDPDSGFVEEGVDGFVSSMRMWLIAARFYKYLLDNNITENVYDAVKDVTFSTDLYGVEMPDIDLKTKSVTIAADGSAVNATFVAKKAWTATATESWIHVEPASGEAGSPVTIAISADANTGDAREGKVLVKGGNVTDGLEIAVTQAQYVDPSSISLKDFAKEFVKGLDVWEATVGTVESENKHLIEKGTAWENVHFIPIGKTGGEYDNHPGNQHDDKYTPWVVNVGDKQFTSAQAWEIATRGLLDMVLTDGQGYIAKMTSRNKPGYTLGDYKSFSELMTVVPSEYAKWNAYPWYEEDGCTYNGQPIKEVGVDMVTKATLGHLVRGLVGISGVFNPLGAIGNFQQFGSDDSCLILEGYEGLISPMRELILLMRIYKYLLDNNIDKNVYSAIKDVKFDYDMYHQGAPAAKVTIKDFAKEYVKILDVWASTTGEIVMHPDVPAETVANAHYVPSTTTITVGGKTYNTADMFETALRSYLLIRGYNGLETEKYGKNSIPALDGGALAMSATDIPETHGYEWGSYPYNETSGNGGHLVMGTKDNNVHCKVKVDILDNWAMRSLNYSHGKPITNLCGYAGGQLDGYYGCFCSQRALLTYAFFFKYMLDNNLDKGTDVSADQLIRSELLGDESAPSKLLLKDFAKEFVKGLDVWQATVGTVESEGQHLIEKGTAWENVHFIPIVPNPACEYLTHAGNQYDSKYQPWKLNVNGTELSSSQAWEIAIRGLMNLVTAEGADFLAGMDDRNKAYTLANKDKFSESLMPSPSEDNQWGKHPWYEGADKERVTYNGKAIETVDLNFIVKVGSWHVVRSFVKTAGNTSPLGMVGNYQQFGQTSSTLKLDGYDGIIAPMREMLILLRIYKYLLDNNVDANVYDALKDQKFDFDMYHQESTFDYTPSAEYKDASNLWRAVDAGKHVKFFYYMAQDWSAPIYKNVGSTECPYLIRRESTYRLKLEQPTYERWQNQFYIYPYDESHFIKLDPAKTYHFKMTVQADKDLAAFFKLAQYNPANSAENKYEGATIWEKAGYPVNMDLKAGTPLVMETEFTAQDAPNILLIFDFGGNAANTNVFIKDIIVTEAAPKGITIDGDMSDWANVAGVTNAEGEAYAEFKMTSDDTNLYFYSRRTEKKFADLWNAGGYLYYALDLDKNATTGAGEIWSNGPYEIIFVIWPFAGTSDAPAFAAKPLGESMVKPSGKLDNYTAAGKFDAAKGVELEFSIPRADLPAIAAGTEANAYSWGNKSGESMKNNPLAIKF